MPRADSKCQSRLLVTDRRGSAFQDLSVSLFPPVLTFLRCLLHSRGFDLPTLRSRSPFHSRRSPEVLAPFLRPFAATPCVPQSGTATALTLGSRPSTLVPRLPPLRQASLRHPRRRGSAFPHFSFSGFHLFPISPSLDPRPLCGNPVRSAERNGYSAHSRLSSLDARLSIARPAASCLRCAPALDPFAATPCVPQSGTATAFTLGSRPSTLDPRLPALRQAVSATLRLSTLDPFAATPCVPRSGTATALTLVPRRWSLDPFIDL